MVSKRRSRASLVSIWAIFGVVGMLGNGMRRLLPVAMRPFHEGLSTSGWLAFAFTAVFFAYVEGYRGFQQRFSPLVVRRALLLDGSEPCLKQLFAPAYAMSLFHAQRRRKIASYCLISGVFIL